MSTEAIPRFGSRDGPRVMVENSADLTKGHHLASPRMPRRYESEEEEVSEADTPSREEHFFSTTDVESDTGGSEPDHYNDNNTGGSSSHASDAQDGDDSDRDDDTFTLRMSTAFFSSSDEPSRPTSVYTIKPSRHSSGLSPMPLLQLQQDSQSSSGCGSNGSSSGDSPSRQPSSGSITSHDLDNPSHTLPFYSDTGSSDDDRNVGTPILTATSVTYFAPCCKPSLVSVSSSSLSSSGGNMQRISRMQRPEYLYRHGSGSSTHSSTASVKRATSRSKAAKNVDRRHSRLTTEPPTDSHHSTIPAPMPLHTDDIDSRRTSSSGSSVYSRSDVERGSGNGRLPESTRWPLPPESGPPRQNDMDSRTSWISEQTPYVYPAAPGSRSAHRLSTQSSRSRISGYRMPADLPAPLPSTVGIATSSKPPTSHPASLNHYPLRQQAPHNTYRPLPPRSAPEPPHAIQDANMQPENSTFGAWRDPFRSSQISVIDSNQSSPRSPIFRNRSESVSSAVSGSSKFSLPTFDGGSVRSMMRRHRRPHHSDPTVSTESTSGPNSPYSERGQGSVMNATTASKSTTNLSWYSTNISNLTRGDTRRGDALHMPRDQRRGSQSPADHQQPLRSKGAKWLYDKGETVSQVGSKAFNGLGSMIKKRTTFPE